MEPSALTYKEVSASLGELRLPPRCMVLATAELKPMAAIVGNFTTLTGALLAASGAVMIPAFTYSTTASNLATNPLPKPFMPSLPPDSPYRPFYEAVMSIPEARRSSHPILSFAGIHTERELLDQSIDTPYAPIQRLAEQNGFLVHIGEDFSGSVVIHYATHLAGRSLQIRKALVNDGNVMCPAMPACSRGFSTAIPVVESLAGRSTLGTTPVWALPIGYLIDTIRSLIESDSEALLCDQADCDYCTQYRKLNPF